MYIHVYIYVHVTIAIDDFSLILLLTLDGWALLWVLWGCADLKEQLFCRFSGTVEIVDVEEAKRWVDHNKIIHVFYIQFLWCVCMLWTNHTGPSPGCTVRHSSRLPQTPRLGSLTCPSSPLESAAPSAAAGRCWPRNCANCFRAAPRQGHSWRHLPCLSWYRSSHKWYVYIIILCSDHTGSYWGKRGLRFVVVANLTQTLSAFVHILTNKLKG